MPREHEECITYIYEFTIDTVGGILERGMRKFYSSTKARLPSGTTKLNCAKAPLGVDCGSKYEGFLVCK